MRARSFFLLGFLLLLLLRRASCRDTKGKVMFRKRERARARKRRERVVVRASGPFLQELLLFLACKEEEEHSTLAQWFSVAVELGKRGREAATERHSLPQ